MIILHIDTIFQDGSVGLTKGDKIIVSYNFNSSHKTSSSLHGVINQLMIENSIHFSDLSAVSISSGPGSYTGLRIGTSTAKGICYAMDIPLIAVNTLAAMSNYMQNFIEKNETIKPLYRPMIDAGRREVYSALYDSEQNCIQTIEAIIIEQNFFENIPENHVLYIGGSGAPKFTNDIIDNKQVYLIPQNIHNIEAIAPIGIDKFFKKEFENLAYFEPFYLKKYIPGKSTIKGLK